MRASGCGRLRSLWCIDLFQLQQGMLRIDTLRILLRLSRDPFLPEEFGVDRTPIGAHGFSSGASARCCVIILSPGCECGVCGDASSEFPPLETDCLLIGRRSSGR